MANSPATHAPYSDPLQALEELVAKGPAAIYLTRSAAFCGPDATFQKVSESTTDAERAERFHSCLLKIDVAADYLRMPANTWQRLRQLALLRGGASQTAKTPALQFLPQKLVTLLGVDLPDQVPPASLPGWPDEEKYFGSAISHLASLGYRQDSQKWTAADWQLLSFYQDTLQPHAENPPIGIVSERTPIFLANDNIGRVLWLVAERLPGPPRLITPHWWRLGLVPLGTNAELLKAIHHGFLAVLNAAPEARFQIRWWLELYPGGGGWHEEIGEADSVQVSAACVARALLDTDATHPLLDPRVGVSATLPATKQDKERMRDGDATWEGEAPAEPGTASKHGSAGASPSRNARPSRDPPFSRASKVGDVGYLPKKIQAARQAGILTFLTEKLSIKPEWSDNLLRVQPISTFDDAYESLLATATLVQDYKQQSSGHWQSLWVDTLTHQDFFIDERQRDSN